MIHHPHERVWKEVTVLVLIAMFSFLFYNRTDEPMLYLAFILAGFMFYFITRAEEKASKNINDYFHHISSHFLLSALFFLASYALLNYFNTTFVMITVSIGVILFSVGFMGLIFTRLEE